MTPLCGMGRRCFDVLTASPLLDAVGVDHWVGDFFEPDAARAAQGARGAHPGQSRNGAVSSWA